MLKWPALAVRRQKSNASGKVAVAVFKFRELAANRD